MPNLGREIASLDFANLIGGPLNAVVEAQAKAAITTVNFIKEVAFKKDGKVNEVVFKYGRTAQSGYEEFELRVPLLTMLPIPYITIREAEIDFNAKITSINESKMEQNFDHVTETGADSWWYYGANIKSKTTYQRTSGESEEEQRTFDMHVRVRARNQDMPAGTERLLTILESSINEKEGAILDIHGLKITVITGNEVSIEGHDTDKILQNATFNAIKKGDSGPEETQYTISKVGDKTFTLDKQPPSEPGAINSEIKELKISVSTGETVIAVTEDLKDFINKPCLVNFAGDLRSGTVKTKNEILLGDGAPSDISNSSTTKILIPGVIEIKNPPPEPKPVKPKAANLQVGLIDVVLPTNEGPESPGTERSPESGISSSNVKIKKLSSKELDKLQFVGNITQREMRELKDATFKLGSKTFKLGDFNQATQKWEIDPQLDATELNNMPAEIELTLAEKK